MHTGRSAPRPWTAQGGIPEGCNNPSPAMAADGSVKLACTWSVYSASSFRGPWSAAQPVQVDQSAAGVKTNWEDPFIWQVAAFVRTPSVYTPTHPCVASPIPAC